jgi:hypothetical protein
VKEALNWIEIIPVPLSTEYLEEGREMPQDETTTIRHTDHVTTYYMIYHPFDLYFK